MKKRIKSIRPSTIKFEKDENDQPTGKFKATFATMDVIDLHGDLLEKGSIGKQAVRISDYDHSSWGGFFSAGNLPVGKGRIYEYNGEARVDGQLFMDMERGQELYKLLKNMGNMQEWSFSLENVKGEKKERDGKEYFSIKSVSVHEVSPVFKGAGMNTRTLQVKEAEMDEREQMLQDNKLLNERVDKLEKENAELKAALKAAQNEFANQMLASTLQNTDEEVN